MVIPLMEAFTLGKISLCKNVDIFSCSRQGHSILKISAMSWITIISPLQITGLTMMLRVADSLILIDVEYSDPMEHR